MRFYGGVWGSNRKKRLNFGGDLDHDLALAEIGTLRALHLVSCKTHIFLFKIRGHSTLLCLILLGNLPIERAKDTVCFLQQCDVSLVSSYAMCFLQRGGVSLASSAIIYNIVKVTRRPVWPIDPLTWCAFRSGVAWAWCRLLSYCNPLMLRVLGVLASSLAHH